ncbi:uncharacterized protein PV09_07146 [Verruconis gallopava]|uniref:Uncharacterized protein n=1 Tax=Verruconis gallopava TaxID=253628 RepID=A0A0D2A3H9_9PEZI|nr:uncharacterized protein PV09_07146 [Verruconis gallopava]KIW01378.1 hypothetical protein PV09_07146 [Verruconis gallopava]
MDELSQWHRAMTTVVLFGTWEMPISSTTLADAFRVIDADEFLQKMMYATRQCAWTADLYAIKADAIFTVDGIPQCTPIPMVTAPKSTGAQPHHAWYQAFLREMWTIWNQTPSVVVVKMILPISIIRPHAAATPMNCLPIPSMTIPSTPSPLSDSQYLAESKTLPSTADMAFY